MKKKQFIDPTGTPLTPSKHGNKCLGNGERPEYECCCDECDYYLKCFPEYLRKIKISGLKRRIKNLFKSKHPKLDSTRYYNDF